MPGFVGLPELLLLGLVVLLIFGPKRLPEMGRSIGNGLREFKSSVTGENKDEQQEPLVFAELEQGETTTVKPVAETREPVATSAR